MRTRASIALLLPLAFLIGCAVPTSPTTQTTASTSITGNWQIQSGSAITSPPTVPYLAGALQGTDTALTGTFSTAQSSTVSPVVESYSGTYNATTGSMVLSTTLPGQTIATLAVPSNPTTLSTGTLLFQCGLCNNGLSVPVVAAEIAPLNGTYTGTLSGTLTTGSQTTPISGTASLTLTQSATPSSSVQFPLTGTVTITSISGLDAFTVSEISGPSSLSGMVSGVTVVLGTPQPCIGPGGYPVCDSVLAGFMISANTNSTATQITVSNLTYGATGSFSFTGTLTLQ